MAGRVTRALRKLLSPRLGVDGSAASSVAPPGHRPIGVETNAPWAGRDSGSASPDPTSRSADERGSDDDRDGRR